MDSELSELLFNGMNEQGYLFQEACARALVKNSKHTGWNVSGFDYSVTLPDGQSTRVDIVLSRHKQSGVEAYAIVECKRAHPEYAYWLFGTPDYGRVEDFHGVWIPSSSRSDLRAYFYTALFPMHAPVPLSWMEVRRNRKSTQRSSIPQTIENAAIQVLLGTAGIVSRLVKRSKADSYHNTVYFFPVIATTARLVAAKYQTEDINIASGTIARDKVAFGDGDQPGEEPWVLLNYPVSESLARGGIPASLHATIPGDFEPYNLRSIYVVNANHLVDFFRKLSRRAIGGFHGYEDGQSERS